jgi:hypothetical protein
MAYDKTKIFEQAKEMIVKHKLFFMDEVPDFLPCSRSTFYDYFPDKSDELDALKTLILINKTQVKTSMRSKWYQSDNPTLQLALMKLISTDEERKLLSMNYIDHTISSNISILNIDPLADGSTNNGTP